MKKLGMMRVDGRSFWFAGYFNRFDRDRMIRYAGQARADRFVESFNGRLPFADARIVRVLDNDASAAAQFAETFDVEVARNLDHFAEGLDGVIVPFPAGGPARDYAVVRPLVERGLPLFLDRIILEQADALQSLCDLAVARQAPLLVSAFTRYLAPLVLPEPTARPDAVTVTAGGDPDGYGADLLDLVDELMDAPPQRAINVGHDRADVLRILYPDNRHAVLQLFHGPKPPMTVEVVGNGWTKHMELDGSQNHFGAMRQFEAFLRSIDTRLPAVTYDRLRRNAAILRFASQRNHSVVEGGLDLSFSRLTM